VLLAWTTDPHLSHVPSSGWERWLNQIASHGADGIVISGDISEGDDVVFQLQRIAQSSSLPIYFVLGNHDFYQRSIAVTRQNVVRASRENRLLHYLTDKSPIGLAKSVFLVGEDGWGDATEGDYEGSTIRLNDFPLIEDFRCADPSGWKQQLQQLGAVSAERLCVKLDAVPVDAREVLVITHVPPYRDACWYQGKTTDDNWAPFFVCGQVGQVLRRACQSRPHCQFTVLCGHTHHAGTANMASNLVVHTGAAEYGHLAIEGLVTIQTDWLSVVKV
jgi:predicted phosphohydrolase